ncbi:MAG: chemotaxis protein CheD [Gemmatimonadota bacterium]
MTDQPIIVRVAELIVRQAPAQLEALGLGSCVAVILHDPEARVGGLAHVLLPTAAVGDRPDATPGRYAQSAVPALLEAVLAAGAARHRVVARLVGGATMLRDLTAPGLIAIGERNTVAARRALDTLSLPLVGEAVGGDCGRSVRFDLLAGTVTVRSVRHGTLAL